MPETGATALAFVSPRILIKPVAQIEFTEWTPDRHLRHSKFVGLKEDKDGRAIVRKEYGVTHSRNQNVLTKGPPLCGQFYPKTPVDSPRLRAL